MRYQLSVEDFSAEASAAPCYACSAEPFPKPDHKAKKHSRPRGGSFAAHRRHRESIEALHAWAEVREAGR